MNYKVHKLNSQKHSHIIGRQDSVTGDTIKENDEVVFCSACQSVFLVESWEYMNEKHCNQTETLTFIPTPLPILKAKKKTKAKNEALIFEFEPKETIFNQIYPSIIGPLIISVGMISDYSIVYILLTIISYVSVVAVIIQGLKRKKVRDYLKLDKKMVRVLETGIELQNDRFYLYSDINKIEYIKKNNSTNSKNTEKYLIIYLKNGEIIKQQLPSKNYEKMKSFLSALAKIAQFAEVHYYTDDKKELELTKNLERNYIGNTVIENQLRIENTD